MLYSFKRGVNGEAEKAKGSTFGFFTYPDGRHVLTIDEKRYQVSSWQEALDILNHVVLKGEKE